MIITRFSTDRIKEIVSITRHFPSSLLPRSLYPCLPRPITDQLKHCCLQMIQIRGVQLVYGKVLQSSLWAGSLSTRVKTKH